MFAMFCLKCRLEFSLNASNLLQVQTRCRSTTVYLPNLQIISSLGTCVHQLSGYHLLDNCQYSFIICRIMLVNLQKLCVLCRTSLDNLEPNLCFVQFFTSFHAHWPVFKADSTYIFYTYYLSNRHVIYVVFVLFCQQSPPTSSASFKNVRIVFKVKKSWVTPRVNATQALFQCMQSLSVFSAMLYCYYINVKNAPL